MDVRNDCKRSKRNEQKCWRICDLKFEPSQQNSDAQAQPHPLGVDEIAMRDCAGASAGFPAHGNWAKTPTVAHQLGAA